VQGKDAIPFMESLVVGDIAGLKSGTGSLSVLTNERGGIIDDTVITKARRPRRAACRQQRALWLFAGPCEPHVLTHVCAFRSRAGD
jgi:glycine cleavage system aminomethyltransferase T